MIGSLSGSNSLTSIFALRKNTGLLNQSLERLASGKKINSGKDDPAGLISSTQLEAAIAALEAESRVIQRSNSNANIADGNTAQLSSLMNELNSKLVASANTGGMSDAEIQANQIEINAIVSGIQRFTNDAISSLDGFRIPDGGNEKLADALRAAAASVSTLASGGENSLDSGNFDAAQTIISEASSAAATARGTIGAYQTTLEPRQNALQVNRENLLASKSRIADTDFAVEIGNHARASILTSASIKVLKISQQQDAQVLNLLR